MDRSCNGIEALVNMECLPAPRAVRGVRFSLAPAPASPAPAAQAECLTFLLASASLPTVH